MFASAYRMALSSDENNFYISQNLISGITVSDLVKNKLILY